MCSKCFMPCKTGGNLTQFIQSRLKVDIIVKHLFSTSEFLKPEMVSSIFDLDRSIVENRSFSLN